MRTNLLSYLPCLFLFGAGSLVAHEPTPDPLLSYLFHPKHLVEDEAGEWRLKPQFGPVLNLAGSPVKDQDDQRGGMRFNGMKDAHRIPAEADALEALLPKQDFTVAAWFTIDERQKWGGIFSALEDNGSEEAGLVLGYDETSPYVGLATVVGSDDDGTMTYLRSPRPYTLSSWHHLAATYDGKVLSLYLDGELVATNDQRGGPVLWPPTVTMWLGGYRDSNENFPHQGRISSVKLFDLCAKPEWVTQEFEHGKALAEMGAEEPPPAAPGILVSPYVQWVTGDEVTIMWETSHMCRGVVRWGEDANCKREAVEDQPRRLHQVTLRGLDPDMMYYYRAETPATEGHVPAEYVGTTISSEVRTVQTATPQDQPQAFVVICDTQANGPVVRQVAEAAWALRPHFAILGGDLVTTGTTKSHWTDHYFPNMEPLISRVMVYPVLGNHERDATLYYDYMHLPEPEYYYTFRRGNIQFFMLDSNKSMAKDSEQYAWLNKELAASDAMWKICVHHHPPYSSDDDYSNNWKGSVRNGTFGAREVWPLLELYDKYAVDLVWSGHIHSYERSWPLRAGKPVEDGGTIYMVTGGAGGNLETTGPYRTNFQHRVRRGHHYCYVTVHGGQLDIKAFDLDGRLFDQIVINKDQGGN